MRRVRIEEHDGKKVLVTDLSHCRTPEEAIGVLLKSKKRCSIYPAKSLLALIDVTNCHYDKDVLEHVKMVTKSNGKQVTHSAVVGVDGLKKVLLPIVARFSGREFATFNTRNEALAWLLAQRPSKSST